MPEALRKQFASAALAIWTTTPWTMPANAAIAVNEKLQYSLVEASCLVFLQTGLVANASRHPPSLTCTVSQLRAHMADGIGSHEHLVVARDLIQRLYDNGHAG